jgi:hypothetical protein
VLNDCTVFKDTIVLVYYLILATNCAVPITNEARQGIYVKHNVEGCSCNHFAVEKQ